MLIRMVSAWTAGECFAGELRSLVGVEDFGMALPQRAVQRRAAEPASRLVDIWGNCLKAFLSWIPTLLLSLALERPVLPK